MQRRLLKLFSNRREKPILVRMPKLVRSTVAEALTYAIDDVLSTGDDTSWSKLLSFASVVFGVSTRDHGSSPSLSSIVYSNLLKFNSSLPALTVSKPTIPRVSSESHM